MSDDEKEDLKKLRTAIIAPIGEGREDPSDKQLADIAKAYTVVRHNGRKFKEWYRSIA